MAVGIRQHLLLAGSLVPPGVQHALPEGRRPVLHGGLCSQDYPSIHHLQVPRAHSLYRISSHPVSSSMYLQLADSRISKGASVLQLVMPFSRPRPFNPSAFQALYTALSGRTGRGPVHHDVGLTAGWSQCQQCLPTQTWTTLWRIRNSFPTRWRAYHPFSDLSTLT